MTYYPDLSPCPYFDPKMADKLVAVGWLDEVYPYAQGDVSVPFLDKLFELLAQPWAPMYLLGYAECPWCGDDYEASYNGRSVTVGALNLFVPGEGFLYAAPSMIAHYILAHNYAPPPEYQDALLRCSAIRSRAYFEAVAAGGPGRFAASVRRRHLCQE
jgi:hypothetical protein